MAKRGNVTSASASQRNMILLGITLIVIAIIAIVYYLAVSGKTSSPVTGQTAQSSDTQGSADLLSDKRKASGGKAGAKTVKLPELPKISTETQRILTGSEEYLVKYEQAAAGNMSWQDLAVWAEDNGLFVEAYHCLELAEKSNPSKRWKTHDNLFLVETRKGHRLMTNGEFERKLAIRPTLHRHASLAEMRAELDKMEAPVGPASQSRAASLLVRVDTTHGREIYLETIKDPNFYSYLARALNQTFFAGLPEGREAMASWYHCTPMNLWLIRQLITYEPHEEAVQKSRQRIPRRGMGGPGLPMDPDMMPVGPGFGFHESDLMWTGLKTPLDTLAEHKLLLYRLLARRGGVVSGKIIGELLAHDEKGDLAKALSVNALPPDFLNRFAGIYSEPMSDSFAKTLSKIKPASDEWLMASKIGGQLNNPRIAHAILDKLNNLKKPIEGDLGVLLAAGGEPYTLSQLVTFANAEMLTDFSLPTVIGIWSDQTLQQRRTFWDWLGKFVPFAKQKPAPTDIPTEDMTLPELPEFSGSEGMPPGMELTPMNMMRMGQGLRPSTPDTPTQGWPFRVEFITEIDHAAISEFLKDLGRIPVQEKTADTSAKSSERSRRRSPSIQTSSASDDNNETLKLDAIRVLASLYDKNLADYFHELIADPVAEEMATLALCIINDNTTADKLLEQFVKQSSTKPFGLSFNRENLQERPTVSPGKLSVPLTEYGMAKCGLTTREALIYFDHADAGAAFLSAIQLLSSNKDTLDHPELIVEGSSQAITSIERWRPEGAAHALADVIESTGDFGLKGAGGQGSTTKATPYAVQVRQKALEVLGQIGDEDSIEIILRIATYGQDTPELFVAARLALARRGVPQALYLALNELDPNVEESNTGKSARRNMDDYVKALDPKLQSMADVALLAISQTSMTDEQIRRVFELLNRIDENPDSRAGRQNNLQQSLTVKLIENGDPKLLRGLAELIVRIPIVGTSDQRRQENKDPYYWNRLDAKQQDQAFLEMIQALGRHVSRSSPDAVFILAKAIMYREETNLLPDDRNAGNFKPESYLIKFSGSASEAFSKLREESTGFDGMPMRPDDMMDFGPGGPMGIPGDMPGMPQHSRNRNRSSRRDGTPMRIPMPQAMEVPAIMNIDQKRYDTSRTAPQQAAMQALKLIASLENADQFLSLLDDMRFYRFGAYSELTRLGYPEAVDNIIDALSEPSMNNADMLLRFLALQQIEASEQITMLPVLGKAVRNTSDETLKLRQADAAMMLVKSLLEKQMAGSYNALTDIRKIIDVSAIWQQLAEKYPSSTELANREVVILAGCQANVNAVNAIRFVIRDRIKNNDPVSEQAIAFAIQIISALNPTGNAEIVQLYKDILSYEIPTSDARRSSGKTRAPSRTPQGRNAAKQYVYADIAQFVIEALGSMGAVEAKDALSQLSATRIDLIGHIATILYDDTPTKARQLMNQAISRAERDPEAAVSAYVALAFIADKPGPDNFELLSRAIVNGDETLAETALDIIKTWAQDNPPESSETIDAAVLYMLTGLPRGIRKPDDPKVDLLDEIVRVSRTLSSDTNVEKAIQRIKALQQRFEQMEERQRARKSTPPYRRPR